MAELAAPVLALTRVVVSFSHPSGGGAAAWFVTAVAGTGSFLCCAPLSAGCVKAITGPLPSPCCAPLGSCHCRPLFAAVGPSALARIHDGAGVCLAPSAMLPRLGLPQLQKVNDPPPYASQLLLSKSPWHGGRFFVPRPHPTRNGRVIPATHRQQNCGSPPPLS